MTNPETPEEEIIVSYVGLRKSVGTIGISVPLVLLIAGLFFLENGIEQSISHFYYTGMGDFLVGALCAIAVFLGSYRGYRPQDDEWITDRMLGLFTGFAAAGVALFPTEGYCGYDPVFGGICPTSWVKCLHYASAAGFLVALGCFCSFKFPRFNPDIGTDREKNFRNRIYKTCGRLIFVSLGIIVVVELLIYFFSYEPPIKSWLFWLESVAVISFGTSWLVKGEAIEMVQNLFVPQTKPPTEKP